MKILITGASGFIGRNFVKLLRASTDIEQIYAVVREPVIDPLSWIEYIEADICRKGWTDRLSGREIDMVVHLAQSSHYRDFPEQAHDIVSVNVTATRELAHWCYINQVKRFIFASTGTVYGPDEKVHKESDQCHPETMYGASKLAAEVLLKPYAVFMDVLILRLFGVYGPGQENTLLPNIIDRFRSGSEIVLAGGIGVLFNPIYIHDCAEILKSLLTSSAPGGHVILNVGGLEEVNLQQVVSLLGKIADGNANIKITEDNPVKLVGSTEKMLALGYHPSVSFEEGLGRTCAAVGIAS